MAASKMTNAQWQADVDARIKTNGVGAITGAILNEVLNNLALSISPFAQVERRRNVALTAGAARSVAFDNSFPAGTVYTLVWRCRDAAGNNVAATVLPANQAIAAFLIEVAASCTLDFIAYEHY